MLLPRFGSQIDWGKNRERDRALALAAAVLLKKATIKS
jgi:hypothetical protein